MIPSQEKTISKYINDNFEKISLKKYQLSSF